MQWLDRSEVLTFEEIERLARLFVERYEFDSIRLTGEADRPRPPARAGGEARPAADRPRPHDQRRHPRPGRPTSPPPGCAGSTCPRQPAHCRVLELTRQDVLDRVLEGIGTALAARSLPVGCTVVVRGVNDDEVVELAGFDASARGLRPLHRVHAARRRRRLAGRPGGPGGRDRRRYRGALAGRVPVVRATSPPSGGDASTNPTRSA